MEPQIKLLLLIAQAIHRSYWAMMGGLGDGPSNPPSSGDAQLAHDILNARIPLGNGKEDALLVQAIAIGVVMLQADGDISRFVDETMCTVTTSELLKYINGVSPELLFDLEDAT